MRKPINNIKDSYNAAIESRKLFMSYASIIAATVIAFVYLRMIPDVDDFIAYMPDPDAIEPNIITAVYNKYVDAFDSVMVNLFLFAGGVVAAYMSVNVWQKFSPGYQPYRRPNFFRQDKQDDESDPETVPEEL